MPDKIDKDAIYGDPEPLSANPPPRKKIDPADADLPENKNEKYRYIPLSTSKIPLENYKSDPTKWPPPKDWDPDKPKEPIEQPNHKPKNAVESENLPLRLKRELMELEPYLKRFDGNETRAKLQLELDKQEAKAKQFTPDDLEELDGIELAKTRPKKTGRRPKQLEKRPKTGGQKWGSKCTKHKARLDMGECRVCEYRAACCKGYPAAFIPLPKILEHIVPHMEPVTFKVFWAITQTVRTFRLGAENFAISWATNRQISKLSGVGENNLATHYKRLEIDYGLLRKQTDGARNKKGEFNKRRNFFDLTPLYTDWAHVRNFEQNLKLKYHSATRKFEKRRWDVSLERKLQNRQISKKTKKEWDDYLTKV